MSKRRRVRVEFQGGEYPYRIISDPWEEGKPVTTIALTPEQAEQIRAELDPRNHPNERTQPNG